LLAALLAAHGPACLPDGDAAALVEWCLPSTKVSNASAAAAAGVGATDDRPRGASAAVILTSVVRAAPELWDAVLARFEAAAEQQQGGRDETAEAYALLADVLRRLAAADGGEGITAASSRWQRPTLDTLVGLYSH
jgi:hypothetical protein